MPTRNIVRIDEAKCNGCGLCVPSCAEGAIQIIDGKARLVKDQYCDGLGACLGQCPQDAISIEQREAEAFDEAAVHEHLVSLGKATADKETGRDGGKEQRQPLKRELRTSHEGGTFAPAKAGTPSARHAGSCPGAAAMMLGGCPGSAARSMPAHEAKTQAANAAGEASSPSSLRNWPVQLKLVPVMAPYLDGADLCIAADCTAFAYADFHRGMLAGKVLLIGCPKLDDVSVYIEKLSAMFQNNEIRGIEVVYMEVPCCFGLVHLVRQAVMESGKAIPLTLTKVGIEGEVVEKVVS